MWEEILEHRERLMRLVRRKLPNRQDAEDCVQETMLRAAVHNGLDCGRLGAFLTTVATRLCIDHHREQRRRRQLLPRAVTVECEVPEDGVCDQEFGRWLLEQARGLRGREQQVMLARARGISTAEFARIHQISVKAAEGAFTRGRARLRMACARALEGTGH
ncbi:sigma-70 family RNA polymerase sigma factor [Streptomyces sp. DSM 42041]|uniref:Sigma-70 family RNA polymerase sigma factor n=1 Tax=Streptomyces hazeniae TaxID=3075538 RepID=A0ABU2NUA7_9ACTN|nr:sigma-70 family RNA polymerase sigma factor [Streptomyces sp. DSM 42041]MDT0380555.1 sigma-70 family RNA polymerase sigma factor [Streptomyces sp. DSM 42041]